jgi:hypothetical protein
MRQAFDHQPRHRHIDQGLTRGWQFLIIFAQPPEHQQPGEAAFDVSTIMRSSSHGLSRSSDMRSLLDEVRLPLRGVTRLGGRVARRAPWSGSQSLLAGRTTVSGGQAQPHPPLRPTGCSAPARALGATHGCATDAALSVICRTHVRSPTTTLRAQAQEDVAACGAEVPPGGASVPPPTGGGKA